MDLLLVLPPPLPVVVIVLRPLDDLLGVPAIISVALVAAAAATGLQCLPRVGVHGNGGGGQLAAGPFPSCLVVGLGRGRPPQVVLLDVVLQCFQLFAEGGHLVRHTL